MHGCGNFGLEPSYGFRSAMTAGNILIPVDAQGRISSAFPETQAAMRKTVALYHKLRPYMLGDFYPLFPHEAREDVWFGYQFHRPGPGDGYALLFRREQSPERRQEVRLRGVRPEGTYEVSYEDKREQVTVSGADLRSFTVEIPEQPGTAILYYQPR
jgi:hypothetical protein